MEAWNASWMCAGLVASSTDLIFGSNSGEMVGNCSPLHISLTASNLYRASM